MEFQEVSVMTDSWHLECLGFSSEETAELIRIRELYVQGTYEEPVPEDKRLEFVRWLYQQGRLQS